MKKLLIAVLLSLCVSPAFSQGGLSRGVKTVVNKGAVQRQVSKALSSKTSGTQFIKIYHFPDHPVMPLLSPADKAVHAPSVELPKEQLPLLSARVLEPDELHKIVFPPSQIYVPRDFLEAEESLYRGMKLSEISELKNILVNGLEMSKSHYVGEIFTSPYYGVAMVYALPNLWDNWKGEVQVDLPVLVRISFTEEVERENMPDQFGLQWIFRKDVPAKMISDVMVFLEVEGTPGWYKAVLKNDEVGLLPVPGINTDIEESW